MANVDLNVRTSGIENLDLSTVEPYDTPIWDKLLAEMVPEDQREEFPFDHSTDDVQWPFDHSDDDDRVKGNDGDDDGREDERDSSPDENSPAEEGEGSG